MIDTALTMIESHIEVLLVCLTIGASAIGTAGLALFKLGQWHRSVVDGLEHVADRVGAFDAANAEAHSKIDHRLAKLDERQRATEQAVAAWRGRRDSRESPWD